MTEKIAALQAILRAHAPLLVAYSGGVDSTCLLAFARQTLGDQAVGVIADSPSLPRAALREALDVAQTFGAKVEIVATEEFQDERYLSNPPNRCYFCKAELFVRMDALAGERGFAAIAYGENADDPAHLRPGSQAAQEFSVIAPLKLAGLTKADVRQLSRELGLRTADAPAQPCLSSRIPHGTPVTREALDLVERGEAFIRTLGFHIFRVRFVAPASARLQVAPEELETVKNLREKIEIGLRDIGFTAVEIDPAGYRTAAA